MSGYGTNSAFQLASSATAGDAVNTNPSPAAQNTGTDSSAAATDTVTPTEAFNIKYPNLAPTDLSQVAPGVSQAAQPVQTEDGSTTLRAVDKPVFVPESNPLHDYPDYTYGITIHALKPSDYKTMVNNPDDFTITTTLISSAGRFQDKRPQQFQTDFYFDDLKLETVIGLNANTQGTNNITGSFTLIEPYGMTLINRMLDLAENILQCPNYLQIPYLLEINFFAYNDSGELAPLPDHTKFIPFLFTNMRIRAGTKGTEYQCSYVPFSHQAYLSNVQSLPVTMEMTAATVNDFFNPQPSSYDKTQSQIATYLDNQREATKTNNLPQWQAPTGAHALGPTELGAAHAGFTTTDAQGHVIDMAVRVPAVINSTIAVNDITDAYNAWYKTVKDKGTTGDYDEIAFIIMDDRIKNATIAMPNQVDAAKSAGNSNDTKGATSSARAADPVMSVKTPAAQGNNLGKQTFSFKAGSSLNSIINAIIVNSTYITGQLTDVEKQKASPGYNQTAENLSAAHGKQAVNWFKITPRVELKTFDPIKNLWAKKITFYIDSYQWYNGRDTRAPIADPLPNPVRDYEYIYTGKNRDIINFNMDFNALFFTAIQVMKRQQENQALYQGAAISTTTGERGITRPGNTVNPDQQVMQSANAPGTIAGANDKSQNLNAASFEKSIYSQLNGDMLELNLEIIGDPDFIKQDELLYYPDTVGYDPKKLHVHGTKGSLVMDRSQMFCRVIFKTPEDIDETTGGLRYYNNETQSAFSGLFHIITVSSEFRQGKFTQKLHLVRQPNQPEDSKSITGKNNRNSSTNSDNQLKNQANASPQVGSVNTPAAPVSTAATSPAPVDEAPPSPPPASDTLTTAPNAPAAEPSTAALADVAQNGSTQSIGTNADDTGTLLVGP